MTDIVIIGGGIAGIGAAACLAGDANVILFEREPQLAYHASGRSAAMYLRGYGNSVVCALNEASEDLLHSSGVLSPRGMLKLGTHGQEKLHKAEAAEMGLELVDLDFAQARFPILNREIVTCAAWQDAAQALDTDALCQHYIRSARKAGARLETRREISSITKAGRWQVQAGDEHIECDIIINAAGAWVDHIAEMAGVAQLGFTPLRRSMAVLPAPGGHDVSNWPFTECAGQSWYAKPEGGRLVVSPSEEDPIDPHDVFADDMVIAEGLARYEAMVTEPVTRVETTWAGLRTMSPDRALVLGRDPNHPDFIWCAGQGGYGFQTAPAASQLIADITMERPTQLDSHTVNSLSPSRF